MRDDILAIKLQKILGATEEPATQVFTLYIPNKDKNGRIIKNLNRWKKEAQDILTIFGKGSTMMPPADGTWLRNDIHSIEELKDADILREKTTLIFAYISPDRFEDNLKPLREFLHRFGRETNQGIVVFEFDGKLYTIGKYDSK